MKKLLIILFIIIVILSIFINLVCCKEKSETTEYDGREPASWQCFSPYNIPKGDKIVFVSDRDRNTEIYTMNTDGSEQTRLTDNSVGDMWPCFSPDGDKIVYTSNAEIYIMGIDGSEQTRLTDNSADDSEPYFSPYGDKIIFRSNRKGNNEIYTMNIDGSKQTNLTKNPKSWNSFY